jgi:CubicO group peptidase (beta-lactamase class C family)
MIIRAPVPEDIDSVTTIRADEEVPAHALGGDDRELEKVWELVRGLYRSGIHPALQICVRRHGEVVMQRSIGYARGNGPGDAPDARKVLVTPDTPFNVFSAAKAVTATLIHLLDERHLLHVDDLVCDYIPEFARHGKHRIAIKHLLNHRAGIATLPPEAMQLDSLNDPASLFDMICDLRPTSRPGGQLAYHAVSAGFVLAEIVQRVAGKDIRRVMQEHLVDPLGFRWTNYGVATRDLNRVAQSYFTGAHILPPVSNLISSLLGMSIPAAVAMSNDPRFLTAAIPSANIVTTANELSLFYQMLLDGGELGGTRVLDPRTVRRATAEQSWMEPDRKLLAPIRYSQGFMLGARYVSVFGPDTDSAFGHIGLTNIIGWADPERQIAGTLMTSGKPLIYPEMWNWYTIPWQVGTALGKTERRRRRKPTAKRPAPAKPARAKRPPTRKHRAS